jgi:internalin A
MNFTCLAASWMTFLLKSADTKTSWIKFDAHYEDLKSGPQQDVDVKVLFLGNGGVGKTQLCRRLRRLRYNPKITTTHGVQLGKTTVRLDGLPSPTRLNLWDFGDQDIYHGSRP